MKRFAPVGFLVLAVLFFPTVFFGRETFERHGIEFDGIGHDFPAGHDLEVRVAALNYGQTDLMLAYGTAEYPTRVVFETGDGGDDDD